jgi:predicted CopG family antitoxin
MPKPGYKSITVSENVYNKFLKVYEKNKKGLEIKGVRSFSGYLTSMMEETMVRYEAFAKYAPYMEKIDIDQNRVTLKDNKRNRIAEVMLKEGELQCLLDEKSDCVHVGFVYSLPELYKMSDTIKAPSRLAYGDTE